MSSRARPRYHHTVRLFVWSIIVNFVAQVLFLIHWGSYSNNGIGLGALREAGFYLMALAEVR